MAKQIETPFSTVGYLTYKRTYARRLNENNPNITEEFPDTIKRVVDSANSQLHCDFTDEESERLTQYLLGLKGSVAGRFMWQLGTKTVDSLGLSSLSNCAATVVDSPVRPFTWAMDLLMLGAGVGYNIQKKHVDKLPIVSENFQAPVRLDDSSADYIVPDTRQGWVRLLGKTLKAAFLSSDTKPFTFSAQLIRSKGALIKGFGGTASGPDDLCWGIQKISEVLLKRAGRKIRPIDALDIMNIIGAVVVAGNVRRCLPEGAMVHTKRGLIPIQDVIVGQDYAQTSKGYSKIVNKFDQGVQSLLRIHLINGDHFDCTANHKMAVKSDWFPNPVGDYSWVPAKELCTGQNLVGLDGQGVSIQRFDMLHDPKPTWDIEVEDEHEFFCNGYLTHNSAQLAIGDPDDVEYLLAKRWDMGTIPSWRAMSNNSVFCNDPKELHEYFWDGYEGKGEPYGLINLKLSKKIGRIGETQYPDPDVEAYNPCAEQSLNNNEVCCLAEVHLPKISSKEELLDLVKLLYRVCKHSLMLPCHLPETEAIVHKNMRIGIGMTGLMQASKEQLSWLDETYTQLRAYDVEYSAANGMPESIKLTTVKPSGCTSLETEIRTTTGIQSMQNLFDDVGWSPQALKALDEKTWIVPNNKKVFVFDENNDTQEITKFYVNGVKPVYEIEFEDGKSYKFTGNHQLKTIEGWKRCDELTEQDEVVSHYSDAVGKSKIKKITKLDPELTVDIEVSGTHTYQLSNGCVSHNTLSLLPGVTPGVHPGYAQYMIRRIRIMSDHPLVAVCQAHGYEVEHQRKFDGTVDLSTVVVSFPFSYPEGTILAKDCTAIDQLKMVKYLQEVWSDNAVSCTVYYRKEELPEIKQYLNKHYKTSHKTLSFLLHSDHGFDQAPYEEISKERFDEMVASSRLITSISSAEFEASDECVGGSCPVR